MMVWMGLIISVFKLFCWSAFAIALVHTLLSHLLLWVEQRSAQKSINIGLWPKQMLQEFAAVFLKVITYPLAYLPFRFPIKRPLLFSQTTTVPIVFVNGYFCTDSIWWYLIAQLRKNPQAPLLYTTHFKNPLASIPALAQMLHTEIQQIRTETGAEQLILVGFSMGGLVASYMSEYLAQPGEIAKIITIGTPFEGTRLATLGLGENAAQMLPDSDFVKALTERIQQSNIPYYCVASQMDNQIIPWQSALATHDLPASRLLLCDASGHLGLLFSKTVFAQLCAWMND
jgi:triacylglycerol lipase